MKKSHLGIMLGIMVLAAGCAPQSAEMAAIEETVESTETEGPEDTREDASEEADTSEEGQKAEADIAKEAEESIRAAEESLKAMEESLKEAESSLAEESEESEQSGKETNYAKLKEKPEDYLKKQVRFSGRIVRFASIDSTAAQIVLAVDEKESNRIVGEYKQRIVSTNLAVGDRITLSGEFLGMVRYRMQTGGTENMPTIDIGEITNVIKAEPETAAVTLPAPAAEEIERNVSGENLSEETESSAADSQASQEIEEEGESGQRSPVISVGE